MFYINIKFADAKIYEFGGIDIKLITKFFYKSVEKRQKLTNQIIDSWI